MTKDDLLDGNAKLQSSTAFATVSAPGLGGAIAQFLGIATGGVLNAASLPDGLTALKARRRIAGRAFSN